MSKHYQVIVIGGGTAGIMVASQLMKKNAKLKIALFDPSEKHYYQPAWTLVGGGAFDYDETIRNQADFIPKGVDWIKSFVASFKPEENTILTQENDAYTYDSLVVCPGIQLNLDGIEGLKETMGKNNVCSNYVDSKYTWEVLKNFKGGNAVFTQPITPIKCGGAPQKMAYLAADYLRKNHLTDASEVIFATPGSAIFGVKPVAKTLMEVIHRYGIHFKPFYAPIKIDGENKLITFKSVAPAENACVINEGNALAEKMVGESTIVMPFEMLHLAPPQSAPDFVRNSPLANEAGWIDVDTATMQHKKYANIFGLGDAAALPTAKTGAAIRKQAPIVVENVLSILNKTAMSSKRYNGYSSCPLVTGYGKMVLAEFDYDMNFTPDPKLKQMLVFDSSKEHWRLWMLKKHILPYLYWNKMMKGEQV